jgi:hypothetical protein
MFAEDLYDCNRGHIHWVSFKKKLFAEIFKDDFVYAKVFANMFYIQTLLNRKGQLR